MARFAEQDHARTGEAVVHAAEGGILDAGQWLDRFGDQAVQGVGDLAWFGPW